MNELKKAFELRKARSHKYIKREGAKGNYKYVYKEPVHHATIYIGKEGRTPMEGQFSSSELAQYKGNKIKIHGTTRQGGYEKQKVKATPYKTSFETGKQRLKEAQKTRGKKTSERRERLHNRMINALNDTKIEKKEHAPLMQEFDSLSLSKLREAVIDMEQRAGSEKTSSKKGKKPVVGIKAPSKGGGKPRAGAALKEIEKINVDRTKGKTVTIGGKKKAKIGDTVRLSVNEATKKAGMTALSSGTATIVGKHYSGALVVRDSKGKEGLALPSELTQTDSKLTKFVDKSVKNGHLGKSDVEVIQQAIAKGYNVDFVKIRNMVAETELEQLEEHGQEDAAGQEAEAARKMSKDKFLKEYFDEDYAKDDPEGAAGFEDAGSRADFAYESFMQHNFDPKEELKKQWGGTTPPDDLIASSISMDAEQWLDEGKHVYE